MFTVCDEDLEVTRGCKKRFRMRPFQKHSRCRPILYKVAFALLLDSYFHRTFNKKVL